MGNPENESLRRALSEMEEDERPKRKSAKETTLRPEMREITLGGVQEIMLDTDEEKLLQQGEFVLKGKALRGRVLEPGERVILQSVHGEIQAEVVSTEVTGKDYEGENLEVSNIKVKIINP